LASLVIVPFIAAGSICILICAFIFSLLAVQHLCCHFYRAMHFSAKRGIAIASRLSVRPSVRPSVCDVGEL